VINVVWLEQHPKDKTARLIHGCTKEELDDLEAEMGFADEDGATLQNDEGDGDEGDGFLDPALYGNFSFANDKTSSLSKFYDAGDCESNSG
jgi:hypothetical protein